MKVDMLSNKETQIKSERTFPYFTAEKLMSKNRPKSPAVTSSNSNSLRLQMKQKDQLQNHHTQ